MTLQESIAEQLQHNQKADVACATLIGALDPSNGHGRIQVPGMNAAREVADRDAWRTLAFGVGILLGNVRLLLTVQAQLLQAVQGGFVLTDAEAARVADLVAARLEKKA